MLKHCPTITTSICYYIKRLSIYSIKFGQILRVPEVEYISYNTGTRALPDIYALALGRCVPSGIVCIGKLPRIFNRIQSAKLPLTR